jgi:transcriptional regulator with XRE-family HTH domain
MAEMALRQERVVEVLAELRERHGLSQDQAARKLGIVTGRQWQRWEAGESMPRPANLSAVSEAFGIPMSRFFDDEAAGEPVAPARLDRIESQLRAIMDRLGIDETTDPLIEDVKQIPRGLEEADEQTRAERRDEAQGEA